MTAATECISLTERLKVEADAGLVDIKFYVDRGGATIDQVLAEADALVAAAHDRQLVADFEFGDSRCTAAG